MFCPRCGTLMKPKKVDNKTMLVCPRCGYMAEPKGSSSIRSMYRTTTRIQHTEKEKIIVLDESKLPKVLPKTKDVICPKCGHNEAYYWVLQTRRADEPPTRFFKCTRCGHVWREYA